MVTIPNISIQHSGYSDPKVMEGKLKRNLRLLAKEPDCAFKFYNIGTTWFGSDNLKAADAFRKALELAGSEDKAFRDGCRYFLAVSLSRLGQMDDVFGLLEDNGKPDAKHLLGSLLIDCGEVEKGCDLLWEYLKMGEILDGLGSNYTLFRKQAVQTLTDVGILKV